MEVDRALGDGELECDVGARHAAGREREAFPFARSEVLRMFVLGSWRKSRVIASWINPPRSASVPS